MLTWLALALHGPVQGATPVMTPERAADALARRRPGLLDERAAPLPLADGLAPMFAADVIMPGPPANLYRGRDEVLAFLRASPDSAARASWTPIRAGVSADGQHGFTFGFMTLTHADGRLVPLKYMSYWVKGAQGWRVAGYKRARRPEGDVVDDDDGAAPAGGAGGPAHRGVAARRRCGRRSCAERAFSDEAQTIGLGPAFRKYGQALAVNMGGPASASFVVGADAIGALVGGGAPPGAPSPVEWSTDVALVASSGDLGISFGFIRPNARPAGAPGATRGHAVLHHLVASLARRALALHRRVGRRAAAAA